MSGRRAIVQGLALLGILVLAVGWGVAQADTCNKYAPLLARLDTNRNGPLAPVALHLAQGRQESSCNPAVTAFDNGRGFAQMMDATSITVSKICPEIGPPTPYSVVWSINAMLCYDNWLYQRVQGMDDCQKWGAVLSAYNGGLGYVQQSQRKSETPQVWFGATEYVPSKQSKANFDAARSYPHKIIFKHQPRYIKWGSTVVCGQKGMP